MNKLNEVNSDHNNLDSNLGDDIQNRLLAISPNSALSETSPLLARAKRIHTSAHAIYTNTTGSIRSWTHASISGSLSPLLDRLPTIDEHVKSDYFQSPLRTLFIESCVLLKHAVPTSLAYLQEHSAVLAPIITIGHLSTVPLAATTIASMIGSLTAYNFVEGLTSALDIVLAPDAPHASFASFWWVCTVALLLLTLIPIASVWSFSERILLDLKIEPEVAHLASLNLHLTAVGIPAFAVNEVARRYLTAQGSSTVHRRIMTLGATLNGVLSYTLVLSPSPLRMGFTGAPIATTICYNLVAILSTLYIIFRPCVLPEVIELTTASGRPSLFHGLETLLKLGLAGIARTAAVVWSKDILSFSSSMLGPGVLATQAVLLATVSTAYQASRSISETSHRRISALLSQGHVNRAKLATIASVLVTLGHLLAICIILLAFSEFWTNIFTRDTAVLRDVNTLLPLVALYIVFQGLGTTVDGLLRAVNKPAVYPALIISADYFGGIPFSIWLTFKEGWGLSGLWTGLIASLLYSCTVGSIIPLRSNAWSGPSRQHHASCSRRCKRLGSQEGPGL